MPKAAGMPRSSAARRYSRPLGLRSLLLVCAPLLLANQTVAQNPAGLARSAADNDVISFEGIKLTSDIGRAYKGDLNGLQLYREVYRLQLRRGEAATFELSSQVFDPKLMIISADGKELASNDDRAQDERDSRLVFAAPQDRPGTFYLVVTSVDDRGGDYMLTVTPRRAATPPPPRMIRADDPVRGRFDKESALRVEDQQVYSSYYFDAAADERVQIDGRAQLVEIEFELVHDGKVVDGSDAGSRFAPSLYHQVSKPGRYQLNVLAKPESVGDFELKLKKLPKPRPAAAPTLVAVGETAPGEFLDDSPRVSPLGNRPFSLFQVDGAAGESMVLWAALADPGARAAADPYPLSLEIGADTPAGFAVVRARSEPSQRVPGSRRVTVKFDRPGPLLVRVAGRSGAVGKFTFAAERLAPEAATSATAE